MSPRVGCPLIRRRSDFAILGAVLLAIVASLTHAAGQTAAYLTGAQLHEGIIGKTFASRSKSGKSYTMNLSADGTGLFAFSNGVVKDPVTRDINGEVLCFHGKLSGTECNRVRPENGNYDFIDSSNGVLNNIYTPQ